MVCCVKECDLLLSYPATTLNLFINFFQTRNSQFVYHSMPLYSLLWFMLMELRYPVKRGSSLCTRNNRFIQCCLCLDREEVVGCSPQFVVSISLTAPHSMPHQPWKFFACLR